ncbi:hypothetical protein [Hyalangium versicolor]|uniref:hypothetical protein n=1 Tax=Hyalangium versicolor TaxID=2861190 RepID=UPI001CCBBDF4|nr:hypothetical protein [Hyalangium versicolor]
MTTAHPWKLVAPWYRWQRQITEGVAKNPRETRPAFQKFDRPDFVEGFIKDPQHSLRFKEEVDRIFNVQLVAAPIFNGGFFDKKATSFYAPKLNPKDDPKPMRANLVPTGTRKIYLETHRRYYLVVCELHCDMPGFPTASSSEVCQAGFVVRRRVLQVPDSARKPALELLRQIVALEAQVAELDETAPLKPRAAQKRHEKIEKMKADGTFGPKRAEYLQQIATKRQELQQWKDDNGVVTLHEGWVPSPFDKIGQWQLVEETPQDLLEITFPLYPLFADPTVPQHDAKGKTLYFGVIPTSTFETDPRGEARFDERTHYEIRCFVRRHEPQCPRRVDSPDCCGELVWSAPTEAYRLASQSDLQGTSNRPITIQMPDLGELAAQASHLPFGSFSPMRFVQPQSLKPTIADNALKGGAMGAQAVCFFAIPLITIVALFVLNLFLPIIVFLFGLWFLLVLKFCIPPSFQIDAALDAQLTAIPPSVDLDVDLSVSVTSQINEDLRIELSDGISDSVGLEAGKVKDDLDKYTNTPLAELHKSMAAGVKATDPATNGGKPFGPDLLAQLEFEPRVTTEVKVS